MTLYLDPTPLLERFPGRSARTIANTLGVTSRTVVRWRTGASGVNPDDADRYAITAGTHAFVLWPELADQAVEQVTRTCVNPECAASFVPRRSDQRYCTRTCKDASPAYRRQRAAKAVERRRVRKVEEPDWYQRRLAANRAYKADLRARLRTKTAA